MRQGNMLVSSYAGPTITPEGERRARVQRFKGYLHRCATAWGGNKREMKDTPGNEPSTRRQHDETSPDPVATTTTYVFITLSYVLIQFYYILLRVTTLLLFCYFISTTFYYCLLKITSIHCFVPGGPPGVPRVPQGPFSKDSTKSEEVGEKSRNFLKHSRNLSPLICVKLSFDL